VYVKYTNYWVGIAAVTDDSSRLAGQRGVRVPMAFVAQGEKLPPDWLLAHSNYIRFPATMVHRSVGTSYHEDSSGRDSPADHAGGSDFGDRPSRNPGGGQSSGHVVRNRSADYREATPQAGSVRGDQATGDDSDRRRQVRSVNKAEAIEGGRFKFPDGGLRPPLLEPLSPGSVFPDGTIEQAAVAQSSTNWLRDMLRSSKLWPVSAQAPRNDENTGDRSQSADQQDPG